MGSVIRPEVDGLLVPPANVDALARHAGSTDRRCRSQGSICRSAVDARERFSMERIAGIWEELFAGYGSDNARNRSLSRRSLLSLVPTGRVSFRW
jgi:hypothetical protein